MNANLQKIKAMVATAREALASLKPSNTMDDLDKIAQERALLREKLFLLTSAEAEELERLGQVERAERARKRRAELLEMAKRIDSVTAQHNKLTERANSLMVELAGTLIQREAVFNAENFDFNTSELLTPEEKSGLERLYLSTHSTINSHALGNAWRYGVGMSSDGIECVRFGNLIPGNSSVHGAPLEGFSTRLVESIKTMANV